MTTIMSCPCQRKNSLPATVLYQPRTSRMQYSYQPNTSISPMPCNHYLRIISELIPAEYQLNGMPIQTQHHLTGSPAQPDAVLEPSQNELNTSFKAVVEPSQHHPTSSLILPCHWPRTSSMLCPYQPTISREPAECCARTNSTQAEHQVNAVPEATYDHLTRTSLIPAHH